MTTPSTQLRQTIIITGASSGIGRAAATELAKDPHNQVVIVGRSEVTEAVAKELQVDYVRADYARLASVRELAATLLRTYPTIDLLINNAGGAMRSLTQTEDGFEQTIQVNYYAPFLLTQLLLERLIDSQGGVINTSSSAQSFSRVDPRALESARSPLVAYGNSKLLNVMHARELVRRFGSQGIGAVSFHPGVVRTNFGTDSKGLFGFITSKFMRWLLKSPEQGARTLVWLAQHRDVWQPGGYYVNKSVHRVHRLARNAQVTKQVWEVTEARLKNKTEDLV